ncbi:MAG: hypothetical protein OEM02_07225 [Desulfobulbaceae bacterium]|nr:hypothetical protein [Desulfobulbaceae bacterium]
MARTNVIFFSPYPFKLGEKIHITEGKRRGDWEVVEISDDKVRLRCPVSNREFNWDRFCYEVREEEGVVWPKKD